MRLDRRLFLQAGASALLVSPALAFPALAQHVPGGTPGDGVSFKLGRSWRVTESGANGLLWEGTWTRRAETSFFDAHWREVRKNAGEIRDIIEFKSINGDEVQLFRVSLNGHYYGKLNAERTKIVSGRASWYATGDHWSADIIA